MRVLIDVVHPAQVHFFHYLAQSLFAEGNDVLFTARRKDVTLDLLRRFDLPFVTISRQRIGLVGLAYELACRDVRLLRAVAKFKPDVLLAQTGVSIGIVGALVGVPRLVLEEAEHAKLQRLIGLPFATRILTGTGYKGTHGRRHVRFRGIWVQAYLHPDYFRPNVEHIDRFGVSPGQRLILLRTVDWNAAHDDRKNQPSAELLSRAVALLSQHGRVLVSSEGPIPDALRGFVNPIPPENVHDLLAHATLYIGEGGTMAAEAAVLGTPSIYCNPLSTGYLESLERDYGLVRMTQSLEDGIAIAEEMLKAPNLKNDAIASKNRLWRDSDDIVKVMLHQICELVSNK